MTVIGTRDDEEFMCIQLTRKLKIHCKNHRSLKTQKHLSDVDMMNMQTIWLAVCHVACNLCQVDEPTLMQEANSSHLVVKWKIATDSVQ